MKDAILEKIKNDLYNAMDGLGQAAERVCESKEPHLVAFCVNEGRALDRRIRHIEMMLKG